MSNFPLPEREISEREISERERIQSDVDAVASIVAVPAILDIVCRITGMGFAAVARVTEDRWVACSVKDDIAFDLAPGGELKIETTICNEIRQHREPVIINNVSQDAMYEYHHTPAIYGLQSYISMPIILPDGTFFGTLCAIDPRPALIDTPEIVGTFKMFADLIAFHLDAIDKVAITQARLKDERETSALREEFIAVLGHDLRNPLAAVASGVHLLQKEPLTDRGRRISRLLTGSVERMSGLIDNVLDLARGRLGGGLSLYRTQDCDLPAALDQVVAELRAAHPTRAIESDFRISQAVNGNGSRLSQLASNLLGNALTHGAPAEPVRIEASTENDEFRLSVVNAGEPIPPAAMNRLFQPFARGEIKPIHKGLGLGLYIASEVAKAHGGSLTVSSTAEETRFTFRMPLV